MTDTPNGSDTPSTHRTLLDASKLVLRGWKPVLIYGGGGQLIVSLILLPLSIWLLTAALGFLRSGAVMNYEVADLATSWDGWLLGLLWALLMCFLVVLLVGGYVLISVAAYLERTVTWKNLSGTLLGCLHRVPGLGILKLTALAFIAFPLVGAGAAAISALLLSPFGAEPVERFLPKEVEDLAFVGPLIAVVGVLAFVLHVRWFFAFHALVIERLPLTRAIGRSAELVRGSFWTVAKAVALHHLAGAILVGVVSLTLGLVGKVVLGFASPESGNAYLLLLAVLLLVSSSIYGGVTVFLVARLATLGTLLFSRLGGRAELESFEPEVRADAPRSRRRRFAVIAGALGILIVATFFSVSAITHELGRMNRKVTVTAHRGASAEAPENTLASVRLAIENHADVAELDFQMAADGSVVLFHDLNLKRVTGVDKQIWEMTLPELTKLDVGTHFDPAFKDERIATLSEVLAVARGRIHLNVELKSHGKETGFAQTVLTSIREADFADDLVITSNDRALLKEIRRLAPDITIGMIVAAAVGDLSGLDVDLYSVQPMYATVSFIRKAHADGREVYVWTVNDQQAMTRMIDRGVDSLITDYPLRAREVVDSRTEFDEFKAAMSRLFQE